MPHPWPRNCSFGPKNLGHPVAQIEKEVTEALEIVHLSDRRSDSPLALSFGQQKRVSIAAIVAMQSRVLVMDEPTAGQDYENYMDFMDAILQMPAFEAIVFITHDVDLAVSYANRVLLMADGQRTGRRPAARGAARSDPAGGLPPGADLASPGKPEASPPHRTLPASGGPGARLKRHKEQRRMDKRLSSISLTLFAILVIFLLLVYVGGNLMGVQRLQTGENPLLRFVFVIIGLLIALAIYYLTRQSPAWEVGTRQVVWMAIGAALYAIFSFLFNGTVFVVPSLSQVALRPAIAIPMFFGYAFGPVVGFFTGAVGNMFGDALTGFGLFPQWSVGNGLVGFIAGLPLLFADRKKSMDTVLWAGGALAVLAAVIWYFNRTLPNLLFFDPGNNIFGDAAITNFAGASIIVGFVLVLVVRFAFAKNVDVAAAVTWGMLGNLLGIGFAAMSDVWINGYSPAAAIVGEFLPAAGPNLIFCGHPGAAVRRRVCRHAAADRAIAGGESLDRTVLSEAKPPPAAHGGGFAASLFDGVGRHPCW